MTGNLMSSLDGNLVYSDDHNLLYSDIIFSDEFIYIKIQMPSAPLDVNGDITYDFTFQNAAGYTIDRGIYWSDPPTFGVEANSMSMIDSPTGTPGFGTSTEPYWYRFNATDMVEHSLGLALNGDNLCYEILIRASIVDYSYSFPDPRATYATIEAWYEDDLHCVGQPLMPVLDGAIYGTSQYPKFEAYVGKIMWTPASSTLEFIPA